MDISLFLKILFVVPPFTEIPVIVAEPVPAPVLLPWILLPEMILLAPPATEIQAIPGALAPAADKLSVVKVLLLIV